MPQNDIPIFCNSINKLNCQIISRLPIKMPPPPRPPVICYDLQTNLNIRRASSSFRSSIGTVRKPKVTIIAETNHHDCQHRFESVQAPRQQHKRQEYDQKIKERLLHKSRLEQRKKEEAAMRAELDAITIKLDSVKRLHENLENTYGMSHNAARYFQKTDEEYANLKRKLDQFAQNRSKEAERQLQQKKKLYKFQQQEDREVELRRLRDMSRQAHYKHKLTSTLNGSLSPSSQTPSSSGISTRNSPSSTISLSTCSSPLSSSTEGLSRRNSPMALGTSTTKVTSPISSSTLSSSRTPQNRPHTNSIIRTQPKKLPDFSFYKGPPKNDRETLEITDMNFFEMVEDKTMLEVNELLNKMQSVLGDSYEEKHHLDDGAGDISKLRSQVENLAMSSPDLFNYCTQSFYSD